MIAARSRGLAAIALPGTDTWRPEWAQLLAGRQVTIITDADPQGRALAQRIARDLGDHPDTAIVDLAPERNDGYDLTDWSSSVLGSARSGWTPSCMQPARCGRSVNWVAERRRRSDERRRAHVERGAA